MSSAKLTERQEAIYLFVKEYISGKGYSPSLREIASKFSMTVRGAQDHLVLIRKKGFIDYQQGLARTIVIQK